MSHFTEVLNPYIKTRNQIKNKAGDWVDVKDYRDDVKMEIKNGLREEMSPGEYIKIYQAVKEKTILESFYVLGTGRIQPVLWLDPSNEGSTGILYNMFYVISPQLRRTPSLENINTLGSDYFDVIYEGESEGRPYYGVKLIRPIEIPKGAIIAVRVSEETEETQQTTYKAVIKTIERVER